MHRNLDMLQQANIRTLLFRFFLSGCLIFVAVTWLHANKPPVIEINLSELRKLLEEHKSADPDQLSALVKTHVDQLILYNEGIRLGLARRDPLIFDRILKNMNFATDQLQPETASLFAQARQLGMLETDIVIRRRVIQLTQQRLRERKAVGAPTVVQLNQYIGDHVEQFTKPQRWSFRQLYFDPVKHPQTFAEMVQEVAATLALGGDVPDGDASPLPNNIRQATIGQIAQQFGDQFAESISQAPVQKWHGPIKSVIGRHFVYVQLIRPPRLYTVNEAYNRAYLGWLEQAKTDNYQDQLALLRQQYRILFEHNRELNAAEFPKFWVNQVRNNSQRPIYADKSY